MPSSGGFGGGTEEIDMPAVTGKRYRCPKCGAEFIVTRGSDDAELRHDDTPLEQL